MKREDLSKCVKMAMIKKGASVLDLAEKLGVSEATIFNYKAGKVKDIQKLAEFAEACDLTFNELMKLAD